MTKTEVVQILNASGIVLHKEKSIPHGTHLLFSRGAIVCVYNSGKISVQGQHFDVVSKLLAQHRPAPAPKPTPAPDWQPVAAHDDADDIF